MTGAWTKRKSAVLGDPADRGSPTPRFFHNQIPCSYVYIYIVIFHVVNQTTTWWCYNSHGLFLLAISSAGKFVGWWFRFVVVDFLNFSFLVFSSYFIFRLFSVYFLSLISLTPLDLRPSGPHADTLQVQYFLLDICIHTSTSAHVTTRCTTYAR